MNTYETKIDAIKRSGAIQALGAQVSSMLHIARCRLDDAGKDDFKDFAVSISEARAALDEAEAMWSERRAIKISRASEPQDAGQEGEK